MDNDERARFINPAWQRDRSDPPGMKKQQQKNTKDMSPEPGVTGLVNLTSIQRKYAKIACYIAYVHVGFDVWNQIGARKRKKNFRHIREPIINFLSNWSIRGRAAIDSKSSSLSRVHFCTLAKKRNNYSLCIGSSTPLPLKKMTFFLH